MLKTGILNPQILSLLARVRHTNALVIDRKSTRLNSSHLGISYAVFCLKKKKKKAHRTALTLKAEHQTRPQEPVAAGTGGRGYSSHDYDSLVNSALSLCFCFFFFLMIRRPPRSPPSPTRPSSD